MKWNLREVIQFFFFTLIIKKIGYYYVEYLLENIFIEQNEIDKSALIVLNILKNEISNINIQEKVKNCLKSRLPNSNIFDTNIEPYAFIRLIKILLDYINFHELLEFLNFDEKKMNLIMNKFAESASENREWDINLRTILDGINDYFIEYMANKIITRYRQLKFEVINGCINIFCYIRRGIKVDDNIYVSLIEKGA